MSLIWVGSSISHEWREVDSTISHSYEPLTNQGGTTKGPKLLSPFWLYVTVKNWKCKEFSPQLENYLHNLFSALKSITAIGGLNYPALGLFRCNIILSRTPRNGAGVWAPRIRSQSGTSEPEPRASRRFEYLDTSLSLKAVADSNMTLWNNVESSSWIFSILRA